MPETPGPEEGVALADLVRARGRAEGEPFAREWAALDVRYVGISGDAACPTTPPSRRGRGCGSGSTASCPTTRSSTSRRSPTPAT